MRRRYIAVLVLPLVSVLSAATFLFILRQPTRPPLTRLPKAFADATVLVDHEEPRLFASDNGCRWIIYRLSARWTQAVQRHGLGALRNAGADALFGTEPSPNVSGRAYRYPEWRPSPATPAAMREELGKTASGGPCWQNALAWCRRQPSALDAELFHQLQLRAELPGSFVAAEPGSCRLLLLVPDHEDGSAYAVLIEDA